MINLRSRDAKLREHAEQDRLRQLVAKHLERSMLREFTYLRTHITRASARFQVDQHTRRLYDILSRHYRLVFATFGERVRLLTRPPGKMGTAWALSTKDAYQDAIAKYTNKNARKKAKQIGDTTWDIIATAMNTEPGDEAPSDSDITEDIQDALEDTSPARAATIARTETHGASQDAAFETAQALGLDVTKEWVSTLDERTRETHSDANGQEVAMHERFEVGEDELLYPGDPDGDPEEVINCRCICVFNDA